MPRPVLDAAERLARELGTTANDAIVRLAEEGAAARQRREQLTALACERQAAIERGRSDGERAVAFPSAGELHEAMLAGRRDW